MEMTIKGQKWTNFAKITKGPRTFEKLHFCPEFLNEGFCTKILPKTPVDDILGKWIDFKV